MSNVGKNLTPSKFGIKPGEDRKVSPNGAPDQFGQVNSPDKDLTSGNVPSAQESRNQHSRSDIDSSPNSQHHTLGTRRNQASYGNHIHDGVTSKRIVQVGTESVSFTTLSSFTQAVTFPVPYDTGVVPIVTTNISTGSGSTTRWASRAITVTNTGFTLFVFKTDAADAAVTWASVPVQWMATV